jgi:hypothetical protein
MRSGRPASGRIIFRPPHLLIGRNDFSNPRKQRNKPLIAVCRTATTSPAGLPQNHPVFFRLSPSACAGGQAEGSNHMETINGATRVP